VKPVAGAGPTRKETIAWAFYDWANSAFATTVMAGFFPIFFKKYWSGGVDDTISNFRLGTVASTSSLVIAVLALTLGSIADRGSAKKRFLAFFTALGALSTGALYLVGEGQWPTAALLYGLASVGFYGGNIFYDSLLVSVSPPGKMDWVSSLGYALGYLGGGLLFALNAFMVNKPAAFGLADKSAAIRASFLTVGLWWAAFSLPLFRWVREPQAGAVRGLAALSAGFRQLRNTFREVRKLRVVFWFLLGYWLYIDGVNTVMEMAVAYGSSIGIGDSDLIQALLIVQFVGFPSAIAFGKIGERLGAKAGIQICIAVYLGVSVWGYFMTRPAEFYALAVIVGLVQGGVQALSRSFYARLIPPDKAAEFFGFYNVLGKFAAVIGPSLMGWVGLLTGNARYSILALSVLFIGGSALLLKVDETQGERAARELQG
jgi:UMF1 family MFS transporter